MHSVAVYFICIVLLITLLIQSVPLKGENGSPVDTNSQAQVKPGRSKHRSEQKLEAESEYERYTQELMNSIGTQEELKEKLGVAGGVIDMLDKKMFKNLARESPDIRTRLDELKRQFVEKQRAEQRIKQMDRMGSPDDLDFNSMKEYQRHVKGNVPTNNRLKAIDEMRKKAFVRAEMRLKLKEREKLRDLDETERIEAENKLKQQNSKKEKSKINHPGSLNQLEEVWSNQNGLDKSQFNARTFFLLHDKNGDKILDVFEVEALFVNEVKKVYNSDDDDEKDNKDDLNFEALEEISRMREHFFDEYDENKDDLISFSEFLKHTDSAKFRKDDGWQTLDEFDLYSPQDLADFENEMKSDLDNDDDYDYDYLYNDDDFDDDNEKSDYLR